MKQVEMVNVVEQIETEHPLVREATPQEMTARFPGIVPASVAIGLVLDPQARGALAFGEEPFDSSVLGLRIGRIVSASAPSVAGYRALLAALAERAATAGYEQVLRRTGLDDLAGIWALEGAGFELMDVGVTFGRTLRGPMEPDRHEDLSIGPSTDRDIEQIAEAMVREPWGSRYESDPAYEASRIRELRTRWLWNSHRGRADVVLVGALDGRAAGYVTCRLDTASGHGEIELVGTLPGFRGRRVASRVLAHAVAWFSRRATTITVRTQATNTAAANLYESGGFTLRGTDLTFRLALGRRVGEGS
jgi:ribosomal protein S18 acetylase RimI-like enzyme